MSKRRHIEFTKNNYEKDVYKNMVKQPSRDLQDTNEKYSLIFEETSVPLKTEETESKYDDNKTLPKPISTKLVEFIAEHAVGLIITLITSICAWNIYLQISDAVKKEQINSLKEDITEINSQIEGLKELYVRKDIFDLTIDNLEEKLTTLTEKINNIE